MGCFVAVARARCASRRAPPGPASVIAEAEVPPAAQRLRNSAPTGPVGVIAEAQVPPAAQRLRNHQSPRWSPRLGALPGALLDATLMPAGWLTDPSSPAVVAVRMNAWVAVPKWLVWPDGAPWVASSPSPVPVALLAELHPGLPASLRRLRCRQRHNGSAITRRQGLPASLRRRRCHRRHNASATPGPADADLRH
jgi:hypothetical protein